MKQRYLLKSNAVNLRALALVFIAFFLGGMSALGQNTWKPAGTTSATYVLRSNGTGNNFNVYQANGTTLVGSNYTQINGRVNFSPNVNITLIFENTQTILFDGQFDFNGDNSSLTMRLGDISAATGNPNIAHSSTNPTLKIVGNTGWSGQKVAFYLRSKSSTEVNQRKLIIEGAPATGTENIANFQYNWDNNFVIDGDGPSFAVVDGNTMSPKVQASNSGQVKDYGLFRLQQGTLHLTNVTVQNFSTSWVNAGMAQVFTGNATAGVDLKFEHCYFTHIGARSTTGSPVLRMQGQGGTNENRNVLLKNCKFENTFGSYSLAVGQTTLIDNANGTIRTLGNNKTPLTIEGCHLVNNYGCPVRWHGCGSSEKMVVKDCLIEDNFTCLDANANGGGGLLLKGPSIIENCIIQNNHTNGSGGGIYLSTYTDFNDGTIGLVPEHTTLKLDKKTVIQNNIAQGNGGGVAIEAVRMKNDYPGSTYLTQTDGYVYWTANEDGTAKEPFKVQFIQNGGKVINNTANGRFGGGIYIARPKECTFYGVECTLDSGRIVNNKVNVHAEGSGGGVAIVTTKPEETVNPPASYFPNEVKPQDVKVEVSRSTESAYKMLIQDNQAKNNGGGVYVEAYPLTYHDVTSQVRTTVFDYSDVDNNTATNNGGGIYVENGSVSILQEGSGDNAKSPTIQKNTATNNNGGGVFLNNGDIYMKGATIGLDAAGNTAGTSGGGIYVNNGEIYMLNTSVGYNKANTAHGGGIYLNEGLITSEYTLIQKNTANRNGGGINNHNGDIRIKGSIIGGENMGNIATTGSGGGVYTNLGSIFINYWDPAGGTNYVVQDAAQPSEITHNVAGQNGGGINTHQGFIFAVGKDYGSKVKISNNTATTGSGGGVFCMGDEAASAEYILLVNAEINNNEASTGTGATVNNVTTGCGGGIYLQYGIINLTASTVNGNTANWNGGGINNHDGNINLLGSEVSSNTAHHSGGGIYTNFGNIDIDDYAENSTNSVTLRQSKVNDNHADFNGGGIDTHYGTITINKDEDNDHIEIMGNTAGVNGGGIYANQGTILAYNARVESNSAGNNGGGANNHSGDIIFYGGIVSNNTAKNGHGGGIYTNVGDIHLLSFPSDIPINEITAFNGVELYNNLARYNGGGINNHTGRVNMRYATLRNNTSTLGNGGGIFCEGPHSSATGYTIRMLNSYMRDNKTRGANGTEENPTGRGGGIYLKYGSIFTQGSNIIGNSANINGGGLNNHEGDIRVYGCELRENKALTGHGGGIYTQKGNITTGPCGLSGRTLIQKNTAQLNGGGIDNHEGKIIINGDYIGHPGNDTYNTDHSELGNIAIAGHGGGVFVKSGSIEMYGGAISYNKAGSKDGSTTLGGNGGGVNIGGEGGEGGEGGTFIIKKREAKPTVDIIEVELGRDEENADKYTATIHYHIIDNLNQEYYTEPAFGFTSDAVDDRLVWVSTNQGLANVAASSEEGDLPGCRRLTISNLEPGTDYTVKISVKNKQSPENYPKTGYSDDCTFTTLSASPMVLTGAVSNIGSTSATANGKVVDNGVGPTEDDPNGIAVEARGIIYSTNAPSASHPLEVGQSGVILVPEFPIGTDDYFTLDLTGLESSQTYYVRAYAFKDRKYGYGEVEEFQTLGPLPNMGNDTVDFAQVGVQDGKYTYSFTFTMPEGTIMSNLMDYGFILSTDDDPELKPENIVTLTGTSGRTFTGTKSGLSPNTTYYVSAFASNTTNVHEPAYLPQYALTTPKDFITPNGNLPVVRAVRISEITQNSAKITGKIVYEGENPITVYGICYSNSEHFPTEHSTDCYHVEVNGTVEEGQEFTLTIPKDALSPSSQNNSNLSPSTTYYLRAYAANVNNPEEDKIAYSNDFSFTTMPLTPPQVHVNVTDIKANDASVVCTVDWGGQTFDPTNSAFTYGIYYREVGTDNYIQVPGSGLTAENNSEFTVKFSESNIALSPETQYQVYAYASNTLGTTDTHSYPVTFTTTYNPPIFNLENIVITTTDGSITVSGITVTAGADYPITKYGICFSDEPNPTIESESLDHDCGHSETIGPINPGETQSNIGATFAASDYPVNSNKRYYITVYAHSEQAVHTHNTYSEQRVCLTLPLVATGEHQGATATTVNLSGVINSTDPNHYIAEYGVCYSTSNTDPQIGGNDVNHKAVTVTAPNPSTTHFIITLNSTDDGITTGNYYWRAYVKNADNKYNYATTVKQEKFLTDYQITATTYPDGIGSVSVSNNGYFYAGDECTLTATPSESFQNWTKSSDASWSSNVNPLTITVSASDQYVAHFDQSHQYTITANAVTGGSATGGGSYAYGDDCTLVATADNGYRFVNWTKDNVQVSDASTYEFEVTESGTYIANFVQVFTITATSENSAHGTATCSGTTFDNGATCTLTAEAADGYQFSNWTKDGETEPVSTNANYTFTVSSATAGNYVAHFALVYTIAATANPSIGGTVSGAGTFASGANCTLEALPNTGYQFTKWMEGNTQVSTNPTYTIENISANHTLVAHFDNITYTITAISTSTAQGTVTVSGGTGSGNNVFHYDQLCSLTAVPENTYRFEKWVKVESGEETEVSISPIYSFYVYEAGTYKAYFKKEYMIAATADPTNSGTITGTGLYDEGDDATLTAAPNPGYFFVNWTENGEVVPEDPTNPILNISNLDSDHTFVAHFGYIDYTITATSTNDAQGTVTVSGGTGTGNNVFHYGETCTLTATAAEGYRFFNWTKVGETEPVSTQATCEVTVTGDATYVANFIQVFTITAASADPTQGTVTGGGTFDSGATCTLTATAVDGYQFANWTKDGNPVSTNANYTFTVNSTTAGNYAAHFEEDNGGGGGGKSTPNRPREIYPSFGINPLFMEMTPLEQALWASVADDTIHVAPKNRDGNPPMKTDTAGCLITKPEINRNDAVLNGGGIYVNINDASVLFSDGEINWNHATESGGGVYIGENAEMTMINQCEVKHNHVDAFVIDVTGPNDKGGGGIFLNGVLYVGDGTDAIHSLTVTDNWAGTGNYSYHPVDPALNNRNNVFLPNDPDPLPEDEEWDELNEGKKKRVITLLSDISKKYYTGEHIGTPVTEPILYPNEPTAYYTNIGISVEHGFRGVIYTKLLGAEDSPEPEDVTHEAWLSDLVPEQGGALESAFFDDANMYYALHVHNTKNPDNLKRQYDYLYGCWTTAVRTNPLGINDQYYPLPAGVPDHYSTETVNGVETWHIYTKYGLAWFTSYVNGLNLVSTDGATLPPAKPNVNAFLERDVDMREHIWVPIGSAAPAKGFGTEIAFTNGGFYLGEFNGQGHIITGLQCRYVTGIEKYGLFGTVGDGGKVKNTFVDDYVFWTFKKGTENACAYRIGGIAAEASGNAVISCSEARGIIDVPVTECITKDTYAGGLVGNVISTTGKSVLIHSSMAMPEIYGSVRYVGGLVGQLGENNRLLNSFANPIFPAEENYQDTCWLSCHYDATLEKWIADEVANIYFGGLVGVNNGRVENCYSRLQGNEPIGNVNITGTLPTGVVNNFGKSIFGWFAGTSKSNINYCYAPRVANDVPEEEEPYNYETSFNYVKVSQTGSLLEGHDNYGTTLRYSGKYGFKHRDHQMRLLPGNTNIYEQAAATGKPGANDTLVGGLMFTLNRWVTEKNAVTETSSPYYSKDFAVWTRTMASYINDDYPVPMLIYKNEDETFNCVGSKDEIYLLYEDNINDMWTAKKFDTISNNYTPRSAMYLYDVQPGNPPADVEISGNVNVPLHIHEDIGITQPADAELIARAGVTIKNARKDEDDFTADPNWHLFSSAIQDVPMGLDYHTDTTYNNGYDYNTPYGGQRYSQDIPNKAKHHVSVWSNRNYFDPPQTTWFQSDNNSTLSYNASRNKIGYFPTNTPYGTWRPGFTGGHTSSAHSAQDGFFDLYCYSEEFYHWINFKREGSSDWKDHWHMDPDDYSDHWRLDYGYDIPNSTGEGSTFNLGNEPYLLTGKGYMMALSSESMMMADGLLNTGNIYAPVTLTAVGTHSPRPWRRYDEPWRTLNMIGNPYQSYLDFYEFVFNTEANNKNLLYSVNGYYCYALRDDKNKENPYVYYTTMQSDNPEYSASRFIHPHQGFFVKVKGSGNIKFNNTMRSAISYNSTFREEQLNYPLVNLLCYDSQGKRDLTTVELKRPDQGGGLKMTNLNASNGLIGAYMDGETYQTLFTPEGINIVPVHFKALEDGIFTLRWNTLHGDFTYLHLIDNLTGADVDCLTTDEYIFEGKSTDYKTRFKLIFECTGVEENDDENVLDHFAFFFGSELMVNGEGTLQMFDINGRCLMTSQLEGVQNSINLPRVAAGIYLLRLIGDKQTRIQKIVIK